MAGNTQVFIGAVLTAITHSKAGRLRLIATGGSKRNAKVPHVPTIGETVPGYESYIWWGFFAPRGTPPAVISHINSEVNNGVLAAPDLLKTLDAQGAVRRPMSTEEFGRFMAQETAKWTEVISAAGIKEQ